MHRLKKIDLGSVAIYSFLMIFIIMFVILSFFYLISKLFVPTEFFEASQIPFGGSFLFFIFLTLLYSIIAAVVNVIVVFIYNLLSTRIGGIKIELSEMDSTPAAAKVESSD